MSFAIPECVGTPVFALEEAGIYLTVATNTSCGGALTSLPSALPSAPVSGDVAVAALIFKHNGLFKHNGIITHGAGFV